MSVKKSVSKADGAEAEKRKLRYIDIAIKDCGVSRKKLLQITPSI